MKLARQWLVPNRPTQADQKRETRRSRQARLHRLSSTSSKMRLWIRQDRSDSFRMGFHTMSDVIRSIGMDFSVGQIGQFSHGFHSTSDVIRSIGVDFSGLIFSGWPIPVARSRAGRALDHASAGGALAQELIRGSSGRGLVDRGRNQLLNISVDGRGSFTSDVLIRIGWGYPGPERRNRR